MKNLGYVIWTPLPHLSGKTHCLDPGAIAAVELLDLWSSQLLCKVLFKIQILEAGERILQLRALAALGSISSTHMGSSQLSVTPVTEDQMSPLDMLLSKTLICMK